MKRKILYSVFGIIFILIVVFTHHLLFGKLFAYSPVYIGFEKNEMQNTEIYIQDGSDIPNLKSIDTLIPIVEEFHGLKFKYKPKIYIFRDSSAFLNRSISKARFCVYPNSNLFISPWAIKEAQAGKISMEIYVTHELSHTLIYQHCGLFSSIKYPEWFLEGLAVYSANQMGTSFYPSKELTYSLIRQGNFMPPEYFKTKNEEKIKLNMKNEIAFIYSELACIVDYMVIRFGKEKMLIFMKTLIDNSDYKMNFKKIYGIDFDAFIKDFDDFINE
ncbi:MAG TPA: hypothetical protein PKY56_00395 [Candidatus Kapabacteria bacterium]|nr:hypothetical protein [Candidatus Kapabacteria bacterium]HPO62304.1 hypothetical protein [Candidatus Kapabacteria bacterium]